MEKQRTSAALDSNAETEMTKIISPEQCNNCGSFERTHRPRVFKDGSSHIAENCARCGLFKKWAVQGDKSFRDRMFDLIVKLSNARTTNEVNECQRLARELMRETKGDSSESKV